MSRSGALVPGMRERPSKPPNTGFWSSTIDAWHAAGLDPEPLDVVVVELARVDRLADERRESVAAAKEAERVLRRDVAFGRLSFMKAAPKLATARAVVDLAEEWHGMLAAVEWEMYARMKSAGEALVVEHLAPAMESVVAEAAELGPRIRNIETDRDAIAADGPSREAWARLVALAARSSALQSVARRLRHYSVTPLSRFDAFEIEYQYRRPDLEPPAVAKPRTPVHQLLADIECGSEPAILHGGQVDELEAAREAPMRPRAKKTKAAQVVHPTGQLIGGSV